MLMLRRVSVLRQCASVEAGYEDLSQLGVDRWLAVMAVYHDFVEGSDVRRHLFQAGSAITLVISC